MFGSSRFRNQHGGIVPRKKSMTKQHSVEETQSPVKAREENVQLNNSPKSKHMASTNSSQTLNGFTCTYNGYEVTDGKTEKRVEVVIPLSCYLFMFLAIVLYIHIFFFQSIHIFKIKIEPSSKHPLEYNG